MNKNLNKKENKKGIQPHAGISSLKSFMDDIVKSDIEKGDKEEISDEPEFSKKPENEDDKLETKSNNDDDLFWNGFLAKIQESKKEAARYSMINIKGSVKELLYDLNSIPELRNAGCTNIISAALKVFIEQNKEMLNKKLMERRKKF